MEFILKLFLMNNLNFDKNENIENITKKLNHLVRKKNYEKIQINGFGHITDGNIDNYLIFLFLIELQQKKNKPPEDLHSNNLDLLT